MILDNKVDYSASIFEKKDSNFILLGRTQDVVGFLHTFIKVYCMKYLYSTGGG